MTPAAEAMRAWQADPVLFVREVLGVELDAWQVECLQALVHSGKRRFCLKASKGPGKSALLSLAAWWFLCTRPHPKIVATSITGGNLKDGLWTEMAKWQARSPLLKAMFTWTKERIVAKDHPETWWMSARQWSKGADSSQQADTLAGIHADHVMFIVDEAGGVPDAVVAAAEAGLANADDAKGTEAFLLIAGNPTELSGPLYRACTRERGLWWVKEISGDPDDPNRAPRVSIEWARQQIEKWGRESPYVLVNVFGQFPPGQSNALLGVEEVTAATRRVIGDADYLDEVKVLGVDVARFGDDTSVIVMRQGRACFKPKVFRNIDTMQLAGQVALVIQKNDPDAVFIDQTGIGSGVVDRLRQLGYPIIGIDFGQRAIEPGRFANRRAEMWWKMADWIRNGGCLPDDPEFISEPTGPTYRFDAAGRLILESKEDLKKRGIASPNKADALALTFAIPVAHRGIRGQLEQVKLSGGAARVAHEYDPFQDQR